MSVDYVKILKECRNIAVVGLSPKPDRPSNGVSSYMQRAGYNIIPVNPAVTEVLGRPCYPDLKAVPEPIDLVDVFRDSKFVSGIVDEAIEIGAKVIWLQLGIEDDEAVARAEAAGIQVVQDRCIKVEHARHLTEISQA